MSYDHIVVVIEENKSYNTVVGNFKDAPYINYLAQNGTNFVNAHFSSRPSQPNYIVLFSGHLHNIKTNQIHEKINAPNLYTALKEVGKTFVCYSEDLPYTGYNEKLYNAYVRKHNPSCQFTNVPDEINQPFSAFPSNFANLPTVSFVVPNQNHNAHDGSLQEADNWLYNNISKYAEWCKYNNSLLIVVFDEAETKLDLNATIPLIFYGSGIASFTNYDYVNHQSILKYILNMYNTKETLEL